jgi:carboxyl-terminal processing protease
MVEIKKVPKRELLRNPWVIVVFILVAFVLGDFIGTGRLHVPGTSNSEFSSVSGLPNNLNYSSVESLYDMLRTNYNGKLTQQQVMDGLKKGLAESTNDPYTEYFTASEAKQFFNQVNGSFSGIGAELGQDSDKNLIVVSPIAGFPAAKAGLKAQDIIASINGISTTGLSIDQAVDDIRGASGTKVTLQIVRGDTPLSFTITRANINVPSVKTDILPNNIGYVSISTFGDDTGNLMQQAAQQFKSANVKGIILDMRGNPGGLLDAAVTTSDQWLPSGKTILQEKRINGQVIQTYTSTGPATLAGIPTVVLLDAGSASASEITAGALHDNGAAYIIGVKSYGKGVVQQTLCVTGYTEDNGDCSADMLKVTVASWYRPDGKNINHLGISPDKQVTLTDADAAAGNDTQKQAAIDYLMTKQ